MDAYYVYNQIKMYEPDIEVTFFVVDRATYYYKVMPFGLKNARARYQRLVNRIFKEKVRDTMEVYVNNMIFKSKEMKMHIRSSIKQIPGVLGH